MTSTQPRRERPAIPHRRVRPPGEPGDPTEPIVAELFSVERLEQHALSLAKAQAVTARPDRGRPLVPRVAENGRVLLDAYRELARAIKEERTVTPAAEWLIDNFHIVDEQLREIRDDLPPGYYRKLPKLAGGHLEGYPRILGIAWAYVAHTDSRFDPDSLRRFVRAYQQVEPLSIGELWALAISLRVLLVENLRRLAERIVRDRAARQEADDLADSLLGLGQDRITDAEARLRRSTASTFSTAGQVQLFQRLRDQDPARTPALGWLETRLAEQRVTLEETIRAEHQRQAATNVTVRNVITSMGLISWFDWATFVESVSLVDEVLAEAESYSAMDFGTRDTYRHAVEELARGSAHSEVDVARAAVDAAASTEPSMSPLAERRRDPGFHLIAEGRGAFERALGVRVPMGTRLARAYVSAAGVGYPATIVVLTAILLALPIAASMATWRVDVSLVLVAILASLPASDVAVALVNRMVTALVRPRPLPRLELKEGVPTSLRTLVVVPTMLASAEDVEAQVGQLEVHYLGNASGDVRYALLSDWLDAPEELLPGDDEVLGAAVAAIDRLNERHGEAPGGGARFLIFHRRRRWNASEGCWMGWERKRGKLHELDALLRGTATGSFVGVGRPSSTPPPDVRFVVTLDADTRIPMGSVGRLVGTIAHPLNRAVLDPRTNRVTHGFAILQPRITAVLPTEREASLFQLAFSGPAGIDPYAAAVSDVYQDLFHEGTYTGKGVYDVDAFEGALAGRVPDNRLLSHDLFEGVFARAGLVTDIELFEEFPSHYLAETARQHRWARGDWQLLPWIVGLARDATGHRRWRVVPFLGLWRMVDNLRRTLSPPATLATLAVAWLLGAVPASLWTTFVLAMIIVPALLPVLSGLVPRRKGVSKRSHLRAVATDVALAAAHVAMSITFLAHEAVLMADAIARTLGRLLTRRHLLEWVTAAQARARLAYDIRRFYQQMAVSVVIAIAIGLLVVVVRPSAAAIALPFVILWAAAPAIARWVSLPLVTRDGRLAVDDVQLLRSTGRRTWRFFEEFVGETDNFLPPDNFQDDPTPVVAHRTSPTNIGLYLLATVTARDLGWIGTLDMVERLEATLASVGRLTRYRGHLHNWYDTRDLRPLEPAYVSSVDSGNLCGHLLTLANACRLMLDEPLPVAAAIAGIDDALVLAREAAASVDDERRTQTLTRQHLLDALELPPRLADAAPTSVAGWATRLEELDAHARTLADVVAAYSAERATDTDSELVAWVDAVGRSVAGHRRDLALLGPSGGSGSADRPADMRAAVSSLPTLAQLADLDLADLDQASDDRGTSGEGTGASSDGSGAAALAARLRAIADQAQALFEGTDLGFLFDPLRKLFSIGYQVSAGTMDPSYYDLLASEARLVSLLAIAKGEVEPEHWFRLGRALTPVGRGSALISWSGSMFEYLMPALVMHAPSFSLLDETYRVVVARQIRYGRERGVPWGISESAFNARDLQQTYQYASFGVPGLGLKRGLSEDLVIAPYATALAAMVDPAAAIRNLARLEAAGARGRYGFREALDYTARRVPEGASVALVSSYMAHHQGMTLVAIGNVLTGHAMVRRFHADPIVQATELLLQERMPRGVMVARPRAEEVKGPADVRDLVAPVPRRFGSPHDATPRTHLLSNGRYGVMVTAAGSGYSRWGDLAVTRWREDTTRDQWGSYIFVRDTRTGAVWSAGHQPTGVEADSYQVTYTEDRAELTRRDGSISTTLTIVVSAEHDAEIRRVAITNLGSQPREIELTSYAEVVLAPQAADVAHPAFQNLFVETEFLPEEGCLLATRRPRSSTDPQAWAAHVLAVPEGTPGTVQYETDRARFLGRGRSVRSALSVIDGRPLSNTVGAVLDPIFSLRCRLRIEPGATAYAVFSTAAAGSREEILELADECHQASIFERAATLAWTQAQVQLHHLGIEADEAHLYQRLANRIVYSDPTLRPSSTQLARNERGASGLWPHGISGDLPIVVVRIDGADGMDMVRQLLRAHEYWRMKLLDVDLVIVNEGAVSYAQDFQGALEGMVRTSQSVLVHQSHESHGTVLILRDDHLSAEDRVLLQAAARMVLHTRAGSLSEQVIRLDRSPTVELPEPLPPSPPQAHPGGRTLPTPRELESFNGLGGFAEGGREYVTVLGPGQSTPAPWSNIIANPDFGFQVSESGAGYAWSANSRENQLTAWSNDPVSDPPSEAIYVRDDETGAVWGPTASPVRSETGSYVTRHGQGYSRFEHQRDGIGLSLVQFVPPDDPLKVSVLTIENHSGRPRRLSVTAYVEWALGPARAVAAPHIVSTLDPGSGALLAHNPWNTQFAGRVAFLDMAGRQTAWTADRTEFLGRNGSPERPAGLALGHRLSGSVGAGLDPCAALQTAMQLPDGARTEVVVLMGEGRDAAAAIELIRNARESDHAATLQAVIAQWDDILGALQVRTPDRSMDILVNRWLLYQTLACRVWGRSGFYQAGGAYGFRDQLQDVIALTLSRPDIARAQLLRAAGRQFPEGDVQHWWHPPSGSGVRTRISDDRLWLPYAVHAYLDATGDSGVLDEEVPFIEGRALQPGEDDAYFQPEPSTISAPLYDHCVKALDRSLEVGSHGLPLIGSGDWNDGMNRVGREGRGESVWLGWFLHTVLGWFAPIAFARGDRSHAERWRAHMKALRRALERQGWDGDWYRRAFFDDGTPLGSVVNTQCRIDSIAQSWSVISGAADPVHASRAMAAVEENLVRWGDGLVLLFTPPFDHPERDPGYISGYVPGVRENGGQYTHGAIWSTIAFAMQGDGDKAGDLFSILNPINHAGTRAGVQRYKVEPYVMAADVYAEAPHVGRGGWTWYTGSAGWMYQAAVGSILGVHVRGSVLAIDPCIPRRWPGFQVELRHGSARYRIAVENPYGVCRGVGSLELDGRPLDDPGDGIPLVDDGGTHDIRVVLGDASGPAVAIEDAVAGQPAETTETAEAAGEKAGEKAAGETAATGRPGPSRSPARSRAR